MKHKMIYAEETAMINDDILAVKDCILNSIGSTCEKIYLFGSYAKGTQRKDSDYDFFVLFRDGSQHPMLSLQQINRGLTQRRMTVPVDVLGNYQNRFDALKHSPTIEKTVADEGEIDGMVYKLYGLTKSEIDNCGGEEVDYDKYYQLQGC